MHQSVHSASPGAAEWRTLQSRVRRTSYVWHAASDRDFRSRDRGLRGMHAALASRFRGMLREAPPQPWAQPASPTNRTANSRRPDTPNLR